MKKKKRKKKKRSKPWFVYVTTRIGLLGETISLLLSKIFAATRPIYDFPVPGGL